MPFPASNYMADYKTLLNEMQIVLKVEATDLRINDSQLVVNQITA